LASSGLQLSQSPSWIARITGMNHCTRPQSFLKSQNLPYPSPFFLSTGRDEIHYIHFLSSCSLLSGHYSGFCPHFYLLELFMSTSSMSSLLPSPKVSPHSSSHLPHSSIWLRYWLLLSALLSRSCGHHTVWYSFSLIFLSFSFFCQFYVFFPMP
jgi:hypothetical protein